MAVYGYARVSGSSQDLDLQVEELKANAKCDKIYVEKFTGTKKERPEFQKLLAAVKPGDTIAFTKMDRFARSAEDAIKIIKELVKYGVHVHILNMGRVDDTPIGRLMVTMLSGFAEFERDLIVERLAEGKAAARKKEGYKEGRPKKYTTKQLNHAMMLKDSGYSFSQVSDMTGISKSTIYREHKKRKS